MNENVNPMLELRNDKLAADPLKTTMAAFDGIFKPVAIRAPTPVEKLDMVKAFIRTASMEDCQTIIRELIERVSDEVGSAFYLEEAFAELGKEL